MQSFTLTFVFEDQVLTVGDVARALEKTGLKVKATDQSGPMIFVVEEKLTHREEDSTIPPSCW